MKGQDVRAGFIAFLLTLTFFIHPGGASALEPREPRTPRQPDLPYEVTTTTDAPTQSEEDRGRDNSREPAVAPAPASSVEQQLRSAWPGNDAWVVRVAKCESRLKPRAVSPTRDVGILQVNWPTWSRLVYSMDYSRSDMFRIGPNVDVAWAIYQRQGPGAWACN